jgi:hypothetical protein
VVVGCTTSVARAWIWNPIHMICALRS